MVLCDKSRPLRPAAWRGVAPTISLLMVVCHATGCLFRSGNDAKAGSVSGYLKSPTGQKLDGVIVQLVDASSGLGCALKTDPKGWFSSDELRTGTYHVAIRPSPIDVTKQPVTKEEIARKANDLATKVPTKFHASETSGITIVVKPGRNRLDIDLSKH
jgi:hypothetical protein